MAINKDKNILIQITLSKADAERLNGITNLLSTLLDIELTKSQTIAFLIKNYGKSPLNKENDIVANRQPKAEKNGINYSAQVKALKDKLGVSYARLSELLSIPAPTLKKYASGIQNPQGENLELLNQALKNYGIK